MAPTFLVMPADGVNTTDPTTWPLDQAIVSTTSVVAGLTNGVSYFAVTASGASAEFTPAASVYTGASAFAASAARILNRYSPGARATVSDYTGSTVTVTEYAGASTINGLTATGEIDEEAMPVGWSGGPRQTPIITSPQTDPSPPNRTYAPGNSNLFVFEGRRFEVKTGTSSTAGSLAFRWSEDAGRTWEQIYFPGPSDDQNWIQVDFGSAATRVVEVICCDQNFTPNGYNLDTGATIPAAFVDPGMPHMVMMGDSYVFGQGASTPPGGARQNVNNQNAVYGMTRKFAEYMGCLQIWNLGLRGNRITETQSNRTNIAKRIDGGDAFPGYGEILLDRDQQGTERHLVVIPSTINDHSGSPTTEIALAQRADTADAFTRLRAAQPNCLILFPVGATAPHLGESDHWYNNYVDGFKDAFGQTEAEWIANGAYMLDGSRHALGDAAWVPAGAPGEGGLFPNGTDDADTVHPNAAGHDFFGQRYAEGAVYLAQQVLIAAAAEGVGTELIDGTGYTTPSAWTRLGDDSFSSDGSANGTIYKNSNEIVAGQVYVCSFTISGSNGAGRCEVRLGGGAYHQFTENGEVSVVLDDATNVNFQLRTVDGWAGTVSNLSLRAM